MKKLLIIALTLIIATTVIGCGEKEYNWTTAEHYVLPGETLWDIAKEYCPEDMDFRYYIELVKDHNNMTTSELRAGQTIDMLIDKGDVEND